MDNPETARPDSPSSGIGERLAEFRRLGNMSAQELSDRTSGRVSRSVISNIENGRRTDVTVDELILLSIGLGISPVALALPLKSGFKPLALTEDITATPKALMTWFQVGEIVRSRVHMDGRITDHYLGTAATAISNEIMRALSRYSAVMEIINMETELGIETADRDTSAVAEAIQLGHTLRQLGVDLSHNPPPES